MIKASFISALLALYLILVTTPSPVTSSSHEALVQRTPSGKPYYIRNLTTVSSSNKDQGTYDQVARIVFEFQTPNWTDKINLIDYTCTGDNYEIDGYSCPVLWYWLNEVRDVLQKDIFVENLKIPDASTFIPIPPENCDGIVQHFEGLFLGEESRAEFYQSVESACLTGSTLRLPLSQTYVANGIDQPYKTMREKFFEEYYNLQTPVNRSNDAMYTNARYNFYSSGLFHYYAEARRWKDALTECKARRVPNTLIPASDLQAALADLTTNFATPNGYQLLLPENKVSSYYRTSYEIADCAFTQDSLIAVVQIPLVLANKKPHSISQLEVIPVPVFESNDTLCYLDEDEGNRPFLGKWQFSYDTESRKILYDSVSSTTRGNNRKKFSLEETVTWPIRRSCPQALVDGNEQDEICYWNCDFKGYFNFPFIKRIASDRILVVGDPVVADKELKVVCPLYQKEEGIKLPPSGALEITLPCDCFVQNYSRVFKASQPCGAELAKVPIDVVDTTRLNTVNTHNNSTERVL